MSGYIFVIVLIISSSILYYYYPRNISFELTMEIQKPNDDFDQLQFVGFDYVKNNERLTFHLVDYYNKLSCVEIGLKGYDSIFVQNLAKGFDFQKYDYIITYQKRLKALKYSPYLTKTADGLYFDKKTPLIPIFDTALTDKVYIYRIKKNNKYRAPGP